MTRISAVLAMMASALVVAGGVAFAATIECPNQEDSMCVGTKNADTMTGTPNTDLILARGGNDVVNAGDNPASGEGEEIAIGGGGADKVRGQAGPDTAIGGNVTGIETGGEDLVFADDSDDVVRGGDGDDPTIAGGFGRGGNDRLFGGEGNDTMYAAQRGFPFGGDVRVNKEVVDCGPGEDTAFYDRGVDEVKDNCEMKIDGFPAMEGSAAARASSSGGLFGASSG